ncbi:DUF2267 domain-containing protein [Abyssalbus ytuae]|uniref:DUF2267 domain-containing protein n=1 Tax=Abyssalbus ytuae TaxID=2926907 RepID=A0A9E6ZLD9_9FLAO|nr:DUF2267 domain-containing protein [Abyssalbus ytuae]UOB17924.1 DUF2267 domain-containing protein [Abyssalbus ytuae]
MALNFNEFAKEGNTFMKEYTKKLNLLDNTQKGGRILSSILHALREIISVDESLQLISQFPMFLKAVYVNGWTGKNKKRRVKNMEDFIRLIKEYNGVTAEYDFGDDDSTENYIYSTFMMLRKYVSLGELEDIRTELPKDLKSMVYHNVMF